MEGRMETVKPQAQALRCLFPSSFASSPLKSVSFLGLLLYGAGIFALSPHEVY